MITVKGLEFADSQSNYQFLKKGNVVIYLISGIVFTYSFVLNDINISVVT